jgi:hypothetical protein
MNASKAKVLFSILIMLAMLAVPLAISGCSAAQVSEMILQFDQPSDFTYNPDVINVGGEGGSSAELKRLPDGPLWTATYTDPRPLLGPEYHGINFDSDGNIVAVGVIANFNTYYSVFTGELIVAKYDQNGQLLPGWPVTYIGEGWRWNEAHNVVVDAEGNIWVSGYTGTVDNKYYFAIWKLDPNGNMMEGFPQYPTGPMAYGNQIITDSKGDIVACGGTGPSRYEKMVLVKYKQDGTTAEGWPKTYQVPGNELNFAYGLIEDDDGNLVVSGFTQTAGSTDAALWKLDTDGNVLDGWPKVWDSGAGYDEYYSVSQDSNGDYCLVGIAMDPTWDHGKLLITKYSKEGEQLTSDGWPQIYEGSGLRDYSPPDSWSGCVDSAGSIAAAATCQSDTHVDTVKYTRDAVMAGGFPHVFNGEGYFDVTRYCTVDDMNNIYTVGFSEFDDDTQRDYSTFIIKYPPAAYSTAKPAVVTNQGFSYSKLTGFSETLGAENQGMAAYQLSSDGEDWYYHDGGGWVAATDKHEANTASEVNDSIGSFAEQAGGGTLHIKAFLVSDGEQMVQLESITVNYEE